MKNRIVKRIIWFLVAVVLAYAAYLIVTDTRENFQALKNFPWKHLPVILAAVLMNFLIRWVKWEWYRRAAGVKAPLLGSFLVYFSGFSMSISPGRVGELIKPFMYKEYFGQKMRRTIPLVFCERISDLLGMVILTVITASAFAQGVTASGVTLRQTAPGQAGWSVALIQGFLALTVLCMIVLVWVARQKRLVYNILFGFSSRPALAGPSGKLRKLYYATYPLLTPRNLLVTSGLAAVSWSFECLALLMILQGVGADQVTLAQATFVFCMATIFGGFLFFMPGGLGGFEGSMLAMLTMLGLATPLANASMVIIRFSTLFFSVLLGFLFILLTSLKYHKSLAWAEFEHVSDEQAANVA